MKAKQKKTEKQHENMTGRELLKRKRHCLEISKGRWSIRSKKDFACQVEISFNPLMSKLSPRRLTQFYLLLKSFFTSSEVQEDTKCGSLVEKVTENGTIHKVESVFARRSHKLDELTSKNLSINTSPSNAVHLLEIRGNLEGV